MRRVRFLLVAMVLAALAAAPNYGGGAPGDEPKRPAQAGERKPTLMQRKLAAAQKVLEGVALHDFESIGRQAEELIQISKQAEWKVHRQAQYELLSSDFRRTADNLARSAKEKNIDATALTYVELTLTCVKCHKYIREVRMTRAD